MLYEVITVDFAPLEGEAAGGAAPHAEDRLDVEAEELEGEERDDVSYNFV